MCVHAGVGMVTRPQVSIFGLILDKPLQTMADHVLILASLMRLTRAEKRQER